MDARPRSPGFLPGHVIADKYELEALVGEGGMGSVWRARHRQLESAVALKLMSPAIASQPEAMQRFLREARAAARLSSLHVVKVFDFGVEGDTPFIAMELLQGESLRQRLDREKVLSPEATLWVLRQSARALAKAHAEGIVHRDLKPENLFITQQEDELLKVLDFGVAKLAGGPGGQPASNTRTGALLGTPFYMSPEQARGIKAIDQRADIWALGVIAFECITGQLPFNSEAFGDLVLKICTLPPPVPSSVAPVPAGFDAWFARATAREPEQRPQSVEELVEGLRSLVQPGTGVESGPARVEARANTEPAPRPVPTRTDVTASQSVMAVLPRRGPGRRILMWSGVAALLGTAALWLLLREQPRSARATARSKAPSASLSPSPMEPVPRVAEPIPPAAEHAAGAGGAGTALVDAPAPEAPAPATPSTSTSTAQALEVPALGTAEAPATAVVSPPEGSSDPVARPRRSPSPRLPSRPAVPSAEPSSKPLHSDLFSEPD